MRRFATLLLVCSLSSALSVSAQTAPQTPAPAQPAPVAPAPAAPAPAAPAPAAPAPAAPAPAAPTPAPEQPATPAPAADAVAPEAAPTEPTEAPAPEASGSAAGEITAPEAIVPSPADLEARLNEELPPPTDASPELTAPIPVFTLHGYLRMRGEMMDTFWLGRRAVEDVVQDTELSPENRSRAAGPDPFTRFRPLERRTIRGLRNDDDLIVGGDEEMAPADLDCVDEDRAENGTCDVSTLQFATMRLRLTPQLNLSEDVRVKMTLDVLDRTIAGEPPASYYGVTSRFDATEGREAPAEGSFFAGTTVPGEERSVGDSIKARRAWAEVRNRDLGELRFGRMPMHWGLGMVYNGGDGIDDDYSTDLDRVLGITKIAGFYLSASYDFLSEGVFSAARSDSPALDQSQLDDVDQFTFSVSRRHSPEELTAALGQGELVLNGGLQLSIRNQDAIYTEEEDADTSGFETLEATMYTTDLWGLFRYRGFRAEVEAAWISGSMQSLNAEGPRGKELDISQLGYALELELRLLDDKLHLHFDHGLASGDSDVEGLSGDADFITQYGESDSADTISTFRFNPSYRVDLIMWRNIMGSVTGAYYLKPGIGYDFIKNDYGELLGARLDIVWSRATSFVQTWGNNENLGVELDVSLYFRSEDGPELDDGFFAMAQYGVLFPMQGLGYAYEDSSLDAAQTLRLMLGVQF